jgi:hypothetical protein
MDQHTNNRTTGLFVGILFLLLSIPTEWLFIAHATATGVPGLPSTYDMGSLTITGVNGNLSVLYVQIPIWLGITMGLLSLLFTVLNQRLITSLPRSLIVVPWAVSAIYVLVALGLGIFSNKASIHIGPILAAIGLGLGFVFGLPELRKNT